MTTNTESLLPCPFCGGRAEFNEHTPGCYFTKLDAVKKAHKGDVTCMVELIPAWNTRATHPAPAAQNEREARVIEQNARKAAQEQLYAERERHTAEVKRLQAEIGRLKAPAASVSDEPALESTVVNDACWSFIEAMPHQLPGPIFNDLKPALHAALMHYHRAILALRPAQAGDRLDAVMPHIHDLYAELGIRWGDNPFPVIGRLRAAQAGDQWREAVEEQFAVNHITMPEDPREAIKKLIATEVRDALDPTISSAAAALVQAGVPDDIVKDAQRYRWLRRKACVIGKTTYCGEETGQPILDFVNLPDVTNVISRDSATTLDAAIDAAMLAAAPNKEGGAV